MAKKKTNSEQENHENYFLKNLSPKEIQEWEKIRPILEKHNLLNDLFYPFWHIFCTELSHYKECDRQIKEKLANETDNIISYEVGLLLKIRSGFAKHVADMFKEIPIDYKELNIPSEIIALILEDSSNPDRTA